MQYFLDSNIFIRFFVKEEDETVFSDCKNLLVAIDAGKIKATTSHLVFAEVAWVLKSVYELEKGDIVEILKSLSNLKNIKVLNNFDTLISTNLFETKNVKYIDSLIASIPQIQSEKMAVVSYDRDFDKLGVVRKEPSEII